jgi:hypothetical protein
MADQPAVVRRTKKKFPVRRPPHYGVCPTCQRPWDGVEGSPMPTTTEEEVKQPVKSSKPKKTKIHKTEEAPINTNNSTGPAAPSDTSDIFACPFLPPDLLRPVVKYPRKYLPFVSGQNSSAPTVFAIVSIEPAPSTAAAAADAKETHETGPQETGDHDNGVYDEFADDF